MLLKKLEAYGFKSFADKLTLEFGSGITAVVGPNGSGKSNITEAIRWVLGEQSAKNLRGVKMEDVIFAGSERRKALGIAEVALTLDNSGHKLPIDYTEVTITRRVFRSGESEFFINKVPCRLKDICELFSDTGLGREALSVIGQNQVDEILNNRPEARRAVFEEVAGITKYKNRKRESLRRLAETQQNLLRIRDIVGELENQRTPLAEAAATAEHYVKLEGAYRQLDIELLICKTKELETGLKDVHLQCDDLEDKLAVGNVQSAKVEKGREEAQFALEKLEHVCQELDGQMQGVNQQYQQMDSRLGVIQERAKNNGEKLRRLQADVDEQGQKDAEIQQELERELALLSDLQCKKEQKRQAVSTSESLAKETKEHIAGGELQISASKDAVIERLQDLAKYRNTLGGIQMELELAERGMAKIQKDAEDNTLMRENIGNRCQNCAERSQLLQSKLRDADREMALKQQLKAEQAREKLRHAEMERDLQMRVNELTSHHKILTNMQKDFEGYSRGVKAVMTQAAAQWSASVHGVIADLLEVPPRFTQAIEVALGGALQHIVTEDTRAAKQAIAFLKETKQGRATFLPLDVMRDVPIRDYEAAAAKNAGSCGFALELVSYHPKYLPAIRALLGRVIVAQDMDAALNIARKSGFRRRVVTLEGDVVNPGGAMSGGSPVKKGVGLLNRARELQELRRSIDEARQELADHHRLIREMTGKIEAADVEIQEKRELKQQLQIDLASLEQEHVRLTQEDNRLEKAAQIFAAEQASYRDRQRELQLRIAELQREIAVLEAADQEDKEAVLAYQQDLARRQTILQKLTDEVTEAKIGLAAIEQEEISFIRMTERLTQMQREHRTEQAEKRREIMEIQRELKDLQAESHGLHAEKSGLGREFERRSAELKQCKEQRYQLLAQLTTVEKTVREARRNSHDLQTKLHDLQLRKTRLEYDYDHHRQQLLANYGLSYITVRSQYNLMMERELAEQRLDGLRERIRGMEPVNLAAIEEYQRVCERFLFLNQQASDLEQAQNSLQQLIAEMDHTMRKQFIAAFQEVGREFTAIFAELFSGGYAELQLVDHAQVLESGIEIIAQPPGKKLQYLSLLSGGERALTVIALLFAILRVRPTPFCVIDEIDAALDEANALRFAQFLGKLAQYSQFIIITHRKTTMEAANVMHGITMEEQGVSKLISVKLIEHAS